MLMNLIVLLVPSALAEPVFFPAGLFQQGSGRASDEPIRTVHLSAYRLDSTEVSIGDFQRFVTQAWSDDQWWSSEGLLWRAAHPNGAGRDTRARLEGMQITQWSLSPFGKQKPFAHGAAALFRPKRSGNMQPAEMGDNGIPGATAMNEMLSGIPVESPDT